jgi:RNA polymerase sigma factor (sigma-70 family)
MTGVAGRRGPALAGDPLAAHPAGSGASTAAVERLYRDRAPVLRRFFRNRLPDREDADDLVQEVFVRLTRADDVSGLRNPAAWLQRVARNLLFDRARSGEARQVQLRVPMDEAQLPAIAPEQTAGIEAQDMFHRYEAALAALGERSREVFLLHRIDELTYREIAARLGITVATVEYHMMRALAHFDRALEDR